MLGINEEHPFKKLLELDTEVLEKNDLQHSELFKWFSREEAVLLDGVASLMEQKELVVVFRDLSREKYYIAKEFKQVVRYLRKQGELLGIQTVDVIDASKYWQLEEVLGETIGEVTLTKGKELQVVSEGGVLHTLEFHLKESLEGVSCRGGYEQFLAQAITYNIQIERYREAQRYQDYWVRQQIDKDMRELDLGSVNKVFQELVNVLRAVELPPYKVYNSDSLQGSKQEVFYRFEKIKKLMYEMELRLLSYMRMEGLFPETLQATKKFREHLRRVKSKVDKGLYYMYNPKELETSSFNTKVSGFNVGMSMLLKGMEGITYQEEIVVLPTLEYSREKNSYYIPNFDFIVTDASGVTYAIEAGVGDTHKGTVEKDIMKAEIAKAAGMIPVMFTSNTKNNVLEAYFKHYTYVYEIKGEKYLNTQWRKDLQLKLENLLGVESKTNLTRVGIQMLMEKKEKVNKEISQDFGVEEGKNEGK